MVILEGADCTGKTTLANKIAEKINGMVMHCTYKPTWNMETYHRYTLHNAGRMEVNGDIPVIIDRWALSEAAYGNAYRGGESYNTAALHAEAQMAYQPTFVYCKNKHAAVIHRVKQTERKEMFNDNALVQEEYERLLASGKYGRYLAYDMFEHDADEFINNHILRRAA